MDWSSRSRVCWSSRSFGLSRYSSRGVTLYREQNAAAVPAAWPITAQVPMTRVDVNATCEQLALRPAMNRLETSLLYSDRRGML